MSSKFCWIVLIVCVGIMIGVSITLYQKERYSWSPYAPKVKGVTITNGKSVMLQGALDSGMLTPDAIQQMMPDLGKTQNEDVYNDELKTINDSLEMQSGQVDQRMQVAAAISNFIPPEGNTSKALWVQRNTIDNLSQPGLGDSDGQPKCNCK